MYNRTRNHGRLPAIASEQGVFTIFATLFRPILAGPGRGHGPPLAALSRRREITKMNSTKNGGNPDHNGSPIINGLKLTAASTATSHDQLTECFYPSGEALVQSLNDNLTTIMTASRDVFATSFDLVLLDHSHGVLGGGAKKQSREETEDFSAAEHEIRDVLQDLSPFLPVAWTEVGFAYFVPALTMPLAARVKFSQLPELEKLKVALQTKRVFVNGETFLEYGGSAKQSPDAGFWSALFEFDAGHACTDAEIAAANTTEFGPGTSLAFWLERCIDRDGGDARFTDHLDHNGLAAEDSQNLAGSLRARALESGMDRKAGLFELKRFGAPPEKTAG